MRKYLTLLAIAAGLLLSLGPPAHASDARTAREAQAQPVRPVPAPQTPAALVHDVRSALAHAGFHVVHAERGIPGHAGFVRWIERITYQRPGVCPAMLEGFDTIGDYLSTMLDGWHGRHATGSGSWVWRTRSESVTLWYMLMPCQNSAGRRARASLVIARYSPPPSYR